MERTTERKRRALSRQNKYRVTNEKLKTVLVRKYEDGVEVPAGQGEIAGMDGQDSVLSPSSGRSRKYRVIQIQEKVGSIRNWIAYYYELYRNEPRFRSEEGKKELTNIMNEVEKIIKDTKKQSNIKQGIAKTIVGIVGGALTTGLATAGLFAGGVLGILGLAMGASATSAMLSGRYFGTTKFKQKLIVTLRNQLREMNGGEPNPDDNASLRHFLDTYQLVVPAIPESEKPLTKRDLARLKTDIVKVIEENREALAREINVTRVQDMLLQSAEEDAENKDEPLMLGEEEVEYEDDEEEVEEKPMGGAGGPTRPPEVKEPKPPALPKTKTPFAPVRTRDVASINPLALAGVSAPASAPASGGDRTTFNPLNVAQSKKHGGLVKGKKDKAVPIIAHEGELVVPKKNVRAVLQSSAWKRHIKEIARAKKITFAQAKQYALGNRTIVKKKSKPKRKSYMSDTSESDW